MFKLLARDALSAYAIHCPRIHRQRHAGRRHHDRRQQRDGGLSRRDVRTPARHSFRHRRRLAWSGGHRQRGTRVTCLDIADILGDDLAGITTTVHVPAVLSYRVFDGQWETRQVNLIGIDDATYASVSDFSKFLLHPGNPEQLSFSFASSGYDRTHQAGRLGISTLARSNQAKL